jgi:FkbM family methyltransferase
VSGLLKPLLAGPARHVLRLASDPEYRTLAILESRLGRRARRAPCQVRVHGWRLEVPDAASFLSTWRDIFVERLYEFPWQESRPPRILDLGANIGLSVLYFAGRYPGARVVALEPDPDIFRVLERNVAASGFTGVELVPRAAWTEAARLAFWPDGADGGRLQPDPGDGGGPASGGPRVARSPVEVEAVSLPELLARERFDVVKMDIEGAEEAVVPACRGVLGGIRFAAIEYHSTAGRPQALAAVLEALQANGFRIHAREAVANPSPFQGPRAQDGFDLQLHVLAWKP